MKMNKIKPNLPVYFIPKDKRSGRSREGWKEGIVTHINESQVFVKFKDGTGLLDSKGYRGPSVLVCAGDLIATHHDFLRSIPLTEPKGGIYKASQLMPGIIYKTTNMNPGYVFRADSDSPTKFKHELAFVQLDYFGRGPRYQTGGDMYSSFKEYIEANSHEIEYFELCEARNSTANLPSGMRIDIAQHSISIERT